MHEIWVRSVTACEEELARDGQDKTSAQAVRMEIRDGDLLVNLHTYKQTDLIVEDRMRN